MEIVIREAFDDVVRNLELVFATKPYLTAVQRSVDMLVQRFRAGNKLLVFGDEGALAYAQHVCEEFVRPSSEGHRALPTIAIRRQRSCSALEEDGGFDTALCEQPVEALGQPGDVAWGISTSRSQEIVNALGAARACGLCTMALTAHDGGELSQFCDVLMLVPMSSSRRTQEVHLITCDVICSGVRQKLTLGTQSHLATCPCGNVVEISRIATLSAYCDECFGEFRIEEGIRPHRVHADTGDHVEKAAVRA